MLVHQLIVCILLQGFILLVYLQQSLSYPGSIWIGWLGCPASSSESFGDSQKQLLSLPFYFLLVHMSTCHKMDTII